MRRISPFIIVLGLLLLASATLAQSNDFDISWWSMSEGGGGRSRGGEFQMEGSVSQMKVNAPVEGGDFMVQSGFWMGMSMMMTTPTTTPTLEITPTPTTTVPGAEGSHIHLPIALNQRAAPTTPTPEPTTPTPETPTPGWQRIGTGGLNLGTVAMAGDTIFAGDRSDFADATGGLYRRSIDGCSSTPGLVRFDSIESAVLDVTFRGTLGLVAAFGERIFYSNDSGNSWQQTQSDTGKARTVVFADALAFAGMEENGVYRSTDGGRSWVPQSAEPALINIVTTRSTSLWVGTHTTGIWELGVGTDTPIARSNNLAGGALTVWDVVSDANNIYIATANGVYRGDGINAWSPFDASNSLQNLEIYSLEIADGQLYAGTNGNGVYVRPLAGGAWQQVVSAGWNAGYTVRDLLYETNHCGGLLAATNDGIWVYR